jgi:hypothetical protein
VGLLTRRIGIIINDAFSRIPLSTIRSFKLSCSTNSLVQQSLRWLIDKPEVMFDHWQQMLRMRSLRAVRSGGVS